MFDCLIIGLGPVGAILGNLLGKAGLRVCILERETKIYPHPRAVHGDDELLRTLQSIGLLEAVLPHIQPFERMELLSKIGRPLIQIDLADPKQPNGFQTDFWFFQPKLEQILRTGLERFPNVKIHLGVQVNSIQQDKKQVKATFALPLDDEQNPTEKKEVYAKYLIGCDGGNSFTRKQIGGKLKDLGFHQKWLVVDSLKKEAGELSKSNMIWGKTHQQILNPKQPITYVSGVGKHHRWEVMEMGRSNSESEISNSTKAVLKELDLERNYEIIRKTNYTFHALIAEKWQFERVFLCGDSAHQMPPFLGQGLCSGFRDAENLAWKLELVLKGALNKNWNKILLNTYQSERSEHTLNLIYGAIFLGKVIQTTNPLVAGISNLFLKSIKNSSFIKRKVQQEIVKKENLKNGVFQSKKHKLTGSLFPQFKFQAEGKTIYSDANLGKFFTIISLQELKKTPVETELVTSLKAENQFMRNWLAQNKIDFVIIRPDKRIFGCGKLTIFEKSMEELYKLFL
ncbi:MAG: 3-(3-hydroxy-phenyl)propionate hydroxylase [Arenicella sp.]|jgi:3-(3-hydroxy-phenyl)propionate hydroxylase